MILKGGNLNEAETRGIILIPDKVIPPLKNIRKFQLKDCFDPESRAYNLESSPKGVFC